MQRGYQVPFARRIRDEAEIRTGAVGLITNAEYANQIVTRGDANMVLIARETLRDPYSVLNAERARGAEPVGPVQYGVRRAPPVSTARPSALHGLKASSKQTPPDLANGQPGAARLATVIQAVPKRASGIA